MTIRIEEFLHEDGHSPYRDWFDRLSAAYAAKVSVGVLRLSHGNTSNVKWFDGLGELRIDWGPGLRIYLAQDGETLIVLFGGGTKSTQRKDIAKARELLAEYKSRKRGQGAAAGKRKR
jgi:putative addiction module killer protein